MSGQQAPDLLQEADRIATQAGQLIPCWDELLEQAHAVCEGIEEQVRKATADGDSSPRPGGSRERLVQAFQEAQQ
jgi:hypothetical protein